MAAIPVVISGMNITTGYRHIYLEVSVGYAFLAQSIYGGVLVFGVLGFFTASIITHILGVSRTGTRAYI